MKDFCRNQTFPKEMSPAKKSVFDLIIQRWNFVKDKEMVQNSTILLFVCILSSFLTPNISIIKWILRLLMLISSSNILLLITAERKFESIAETKLTPRKTPRKAAVMVPLPKQAVQLRIVD